VPSGSAATLIAGMRANESLESLGALRGPEAGTADGALSSPMRRGRSPRWEDLCGMSRCWPGIPIFEPRRATSTPTPRRRDE